MTNSVPNHNTVALIHHQKTPIEIRHYRWPSGFELLHMPDHGAPVVSYQTWMKVGSCDETKGQTGLAHYLNTDVQRHIKHLKAFDRTLEEVGGEVNAGTWLDWTYYYIDLPSAHIEKAIELESDRFLTSGSQQIYSKQSAKSLLMNVRSALTTTV